MVSDFSIDLNWRSARSYDQMRKMALGIAARSRDPQQMV